MDRKYWAFKREGRGIRRCAVLCEIDEKLVGCVESAS